MGSMDPRLRQAVAGAHLALEQRVQNYLAQRDLEVSCRRGCFACCYAWVVVGLAEAEYLREWLAKHGPEQLARCEAEGARRLKRIAREKHQPDFATAYFLEANPCPLLTLDGSCFGHAYRPLACRGILTDLPPRYCAPGAVLTLEGPEKAAYRSQLEAWHGPEHYLKKPWQLSLRTAQRLWATEQHLRGFTVVGELASLVYLLGQGTFQKALALGKEGVRQELSQRGLLGGGFGFWVG